MYSLQINFAKINKYVLGKRVSSCGTMDVCGITCDLFIIMKCEHFVI